MWPVCLFVSVALHATVLLSVGVKGGDAAGGSGKAFSMVEFSTSAPSATIVKSFVSQTTDTPDSIPVVPKPKRVSDVRGALLAKEKELSFEQRSPPFYKSSEVSHLAQLQLPLEGVLFSDELTLSGRLVLDISVSELGKVVSIEVVEASDPSGALRAHMLPLLKDAPFTPAYKDGKPVNSVRRVDFTLGMVINDPTLGFKSSVSPGFRPRMDERGNVLKEQPKP